MTTITAPARRSASAASSAPPSADLDARIASAFQPDARSDDVASLISVVDAVSAAAKDAADDARKRALSATLGAGERAQARRELHDTSFDSERLQQASVELRERLEQIRARDANEQRRVAYDAAKAERDRLARELSGIYPAFVDKLVPVLARIAANNAEIGRLHSGLLSAELEARGLKGFNDGNSYIPRILADLRLPAWSYDRHSPWAWPKP